VDGIHDHASGLEAAALIGGAYRNLHNLFDKHMPFPHAPLAARRVMYSPERAALHEPRFETGKHNFETHRYRLKPPIKSTFCCENA